MKALLWLSISLIAMAFLCGYFYANASISRAIRDAEGLADSRFVIIERGDNPRRVLIDSIKSTTAFASPSVSHAWITDMGNGGKTLSFSIIKGPLARFPSALNLSVRYEDESQPVIERFFTRIDLEKIGDINSVWSEFNFFLETTPEIDGSRNLKVSIEGLCKDLDVMFHKLSSKGEATKGRD